MRIIINAMGKTICMKCNELQRAIGTVWAGKAKDGHKGDGQGKTTGSWFGGGLDLHVQAA